ncbi:hypothetical protein VitviT2T_001131 [Vitis vinifera]|uniref:Retrotransposon gag domain-containing protein n=1 Tax=Vitis vinifera TaxID=29760 RepID=A0ABY9BEJ3_VITVI|nr:hypothetical protein VitviT2T_001131 [Vitis vinifera]
MESENPYAHIKEFEDVCNTFREGGASIDLMRLKLFPFTLKDKAKIWLNSLRPRSIRTWTDLQAEFLKKFFPTHRTNGLKRQISNFSAKENEKFYECWERYMEAINACPHHGFDTWLLVSYFYDGMSSSMKQLLETMCGGDFMSKNPEEAMDFLSYVAEVSRGCDSCPIKVTASPTNESFSASHQSNISAAATVEAAHSKADIMSIFEDLTQDDQDSVRLLAVKGCAALGKLSDLVPAYVRLLHDNEAEVRITAAGKVTKFCWILNPKLAIPPPPGNDIQAFIDLLNDELAAGSPTTDHVEGCDLCLDDFDAQLQLLNAGIN